MGELSQAAGQTVPALVVSATDHDILIRVDTKLDIFIQRLTDIDKRVASLESRADRAEGGVRGIIATSTILGGIIGALVSVLFHYVIR